MRPRAFSHPSIAQRYAEVRKRYGFKVCLPCGESRSSNVRSRRPINRPSRKILSSAHLGVPLREAEFRTEQSCQPIARLFLGGGRTRKATSREIDLSPVSYHGTTVLHGQLGDLTLPSPYLIAKALELYPACRFKRIVFAGSVVRRGFDWRRYLRTNRVEHVLNYAAKGDWVVAWFPKLFEFLRIQDLGSASFESKSLADRWQVRFYQRRSRRSFG
jgi:hypothetical protein